MRLFLILTFYSPYCIPVHLLFLPQISFKLTMGQKCTLAKWFMTNKRQTFLLGKRLCSFVDGGKKIKFSSKHKEKTKGSAFVQNVRLVLDTFIKRNAMKPLKGH